MSRKHFYHKNFHIVLDFQRGDHGKCVCRATVEETEWTPIVEIGDTKAIAQQNALDKTRESIDKDVILAARLSGKRLPRFNFWDFE